MSGTSVTRWDNALGIWFALWRSVWHALILLALMVLIWARRWPLRVEPFAHLNAPFAAYAPQVWIGSGVALAALLTYLLAGLPDWRRLAQSKYRLFLVGSVGLASWVWLSLVWSSDSLLGILPAAYLTLSVLAGVGLLTASLNGSAIVVAMTIGVIIQAAVALPQFIVQNDLGLQKVGELALDVTSSEASVVADASHDIRLLRSYGLSVHPNVLGGYLAVGLLYVATGFALARHISLWIWGTVLLAGFATLLLSFSRGAWLAFGAGGLVTAVSWLAAGHLKRDQFWRWMLVLAVGFALTVAFVWRFRPVVVQRLGLTHQLDPVELRSRSDRGAYDELTTQIIREHPLRGTGIANLVVAIQDRLEDDWRALDAQPVHRVPLLVLAELGVVGLLFWGAALVGAVWALVRAWPLSLFGGAAAGSLVVMLVSGLFDHYLWTIPSVSLLWWINLSFACNAEREKV